MKNNQIDLNGKGKNFIFLLITINFHLCSRTRHWQSEVRVKGTGKQKVMANKAKQLGQID